MAPNLGNKIKYAHQKLSSMIQIRFKSHSRAFDDIRIEFLLFRHRPMKYWNNSSPISFPRSPQKFHSVYQDQSMCV